MHPTHRTAVRQHGAPAAAGAVPRASWQLPNLRRSTVLRAQAPVEVTDVATSTGPASGSGCPVLSALQAPPPYEMNPLQDLWLASTDPTEHRMRSQNGKPVSSARYMGVLPAVWLGAMGPLKDVLAHESAGRLTTGWPKSTHLLLGSESLTLVKDPEHHRFLRKVMLGAMSAEAVEAYLPEIYDICVERLERWAEECETHGRTVPALSGLKAMTIKVIASVVMDIQLNEQELKAVGDDFNIWIKPLFSMNAHDVWPLPFYFAMRARERLVERIEARLAQLRQELASGRSSRRVGSTLHRLLTEKDENGQGLTHKQVVDNLLTTLFAGHDTTSSYLSALMFELATRPEVLARVRAEQQQVVARHGPRMTPAALRDMKYTQAVLSEVFRVKNLVNVAPRVAKEDIAVGGYKIEAGQRILLHFGYMMTTDPRWPAEGDPASNPLHPANFNPDRFMTPEGAKQGQQLPFGTGNRVCAGMSLAQAETKVFLATLARGYTFVADTNTTWSQRPILRPDNGLPVYVTRLPPALRVA